MHSSQILIIEVHRRQAFWWSWLRWTGRVHGRYRCLVDTVVGLRNLPQESEIIAGWQRVLQKISGLPRTFEISYKIGKG